MKFSKKLLSTLILSSIISLSAYSQEPKTISKNHSSLRSIFKKYPCGDKNAVDMCTEIMHDIIDYQEKKFNIKYDLSQTPRLSLKYLGSRVGGRYIHKDKLLLINAESFSYLNDTLLVDIDASGINSRIKSFRGFISHELGHALTHQYIAKYCPNTWLASGFDKKRNSLKSELDHNIVAEGIAEYFKNVFLKSDEDLPLRDRFDSTTWDEEQHPDGLENFSRLTHLKYDGGYNLVKPILDIDVHEGILYLLRNELKISYYNFSIVNKYQKKAIRDVEQIVADKSLKKTNEQRENQ